MNHRCPSCCRPLRNAIERRPTAADERRYGLGPVHLNRGKHVEAKLFGMVVGECDRCGFVKLPVRGVVG